eukprot:m.1545949 g.1545949  ORF g.1545949 m.1545949 type:complete len:1124 (-) comp25260_c0_seq38:555-3926(-)
MRVVLHAPSLAKHAHTKQPPTVPFCQCTPLRFIPCVWYVCVRGDGGRHWPSNHPVPSAAAVHHQCHPRDPAAEPCRAGDAQAYVGILWMSLALEQCAVLLLSRDLVIPIGRLSIPRYGSRNGRLLMPLVLIDHHTTACLFVLMWYIGGMRADAFVHTRLADMKLSVAVSTQHLANSCVGPVPCAGELHLPKAVFDAGFRIVQFVTLLTTRYDAGDTSPELQEMGEMAFFHLAGHLTPATESYPPARSTLVFALRELGKTFVIGHVKHQVHLFENIVQNTLHKTENVTLFLDLFQPDLSPEYIKLYYKASELASTGCTLDAVVACLLRFDTNRWLLGDPRLSAKMEFVATIFGQIAKHIDDGAVVPHAADMVQVHLGNFATVLHHHFPACVGDVLRLLLENTVDGRAAHLAWRVFIDSIDDDVNHRFSSLNAQQTMEWVGAYFRELRCRRVALYTTLYLYQEPICRLLTTLPVRLISAQHRVDVSSMGVLSVEKLFHLIGTLFLPFLAAERDAAGTTTQAWEDDPVQVAFASNVVGALVTAVSHVAHVPRGTALHHTWHLYVTALVPAGAAHVLDIIHINLAKLPWHEMTLSAGVAQQMQGLLEASVPTTCAHFIATVLMQMLGSVVGGALTGGLDTPTFTHPEDIPAFVHAARLDDDVVEPVLWVLLLLSAERRVAEGHAFGNLWATVRAMDWDGLSDHVFQRMCEWYKAQGDAAIMLTKQTTAAAGLHVLTSTGSLRRREDNGAVTSDAKFHMLLRTCISMLESAGSRYSVLHIGQFLGEKLEVIAPAYTTPTSTDVDSRAESTLSLLLLVLNHPSIVNDDSTQAVRTILRNFLADYPQFALVLMRSACSVAAQQLIVQILESCMETYFRAVSDVGTRRFDWDTVVMNLVVPELAYGAFIDAAVKHQSWLTLYAHVCQSLYACRGNLDTEHAVTDALVTWIARARPNNASDPLCDPEKLFLLVGTAIALIDKQLPASESHFRIATAVHTVLDTLAKMCEEKDSGGFLGALGLGSKSGVPPKVRLVCRALAILLIRASIALSLHTHIKGRTASDMERQQEKLCSGLAALLKSKQYAPIAGLVDTVHAKISVRTTGATLAEFKPVLIGFITTVFPNTAYLTTFQ